MFTEFGAIISSNGRFKVSVSEAMDHATMPEYPATSEGGIAHFIHSANPIESNELSDVRDGFTREMSKVGIAYTEHMQCLRSYRFSSPSATLVM